MGLHAKHDQRIEDSLLVSLPNILLRLEMSLSSASGGVEVDFEIIVGRLTVVLCHFVDKYVRVDIVILLVFEMLPHRCCVRC